MRQLAYLLLFCASTVVAAPLTSEELSDVFQKSVSTQLDVPEEVAQSYLDKTIAQLQQAKADLTREQFIVTVDRNTSVQALFIYLGSPQGGYQFIGAAPISTGAKGRFDHYVTPLGVFDHTLTTYSDFRAEGTKNSNGIRGYGAKGMRIWDFGWIPADKGWLKNRTEAGDIRFQMHATDPNMLEKRLGATGSKGCVRVASTVNQFMDKYGVLDWHYEQSVKTSGKTPWVWRKDRVQTAYSGRYLVVVDSEVSSTPLWLKEAKQ